MRWRGRDLLRTAAVLAMAGLTGWVAATASAGTSADAGGDQWFYADSGGPCRRDYADGGIWPEPHRSLRIGITGVIVDRPLADDSRPCPDDGRFATATFTAYAGGMVVDVERQRADNERRDFSFDLSASRRIDMVVVQVCRVSPSPSPTDYCGTPQKYLVPVT